MESLSRSPVKARAFLDPGVDYFDHEGAAKPTVLGALLTRYAPWELLLSRTNPSLDGFPSYPSLGDALLAATSDPYDPAAQRIAELTFIAYANTSDRQIYEMRPQMAQLVTRELAVGNIGTNPDSPIHYYVLARAISNGTGFTPEQVEAMVETFLDGVIGQLAVDPQSRFLDRPASVEEVEQSAAPLGMFLGTLYWSLYLYQGTAYPPPPDIPYFQKVHAVEQRLQAALAGNSAMAPALPTFMGTLKGVMEQYPPHLPS